MKMQDKVALVEAFFGMAPHARTTLDSIRAGLAA